MVEFLDLGFEFLVVVVAPGTDDCRATQQERTNDREAD